MQQSIITIPPNRAASTLDLLEEAGVLEMSVLTLPSSEATEAVAKRLPKCREAEVETLGPCAIYGLDLIEDLAMSGESLSDTLFRRGFDEKAATQISEDMEHGKVLVFVPTGHLDVSGLRMSLEREDQVEVYADPRVPEPVDPDSVGGTVGEDARSTGQSLFH